MGKTKLTAVEKHLIKTLTRANIKFDYLDDSTALFEIVNKKKNLLGKIVLTNDSLYFDEISSNYSKKYLGTILNTGLKGAGLTYNYALHTFSVGDIVYLNITNTGLSQISNFSYYGYNQTTDCKERICNQSLNVNYLGLKTILCGGTNPRQLAKYSVTSIN